MKAITAEELADATLILSVLHAVGEQSERRPALSRKLVRQCIDTFWDKPRETRQGHRKRPAGALWSPEAVLTARAGVYDGLTGEHVIPICLVVAGLIRRVRNGVPLNERELAAELLATPWAIVTKAQDQMLNDAGLRQKMPSDWDGSNQWARYDAVGLDHSTFRVWTSH